MRPTHHLKPKRTQLDLHEMRHGILADAFSLQQKYPMGQQQRPALRPPSSSRKTETNVDIIQIRINTNNYCLSRPFMSQSVLVLGKQAWART